LNATDALKKANPHAKYTPDSMRSLASRIKKSVFSKVNTTEEELHEKLGIDEISLLKAGAEGLNATRPIFVDGKPQAVADYATRHRYWQDFVKMKGLLKDKLELTGKDGEPLQFQVLAGIAYVPSSTDPRSNRDAPVADTSVIQGSSEIQDIDLAQKSPKDNDSNS
jgi:hypothetical protein